MADSMEPLGTDDLLALVASGRELAAETGTGALLDRILRKAVSLTDSLDAAILLYDEQHRSLFFAHAIGDTAAKVLADWGRSSLHRIPLVEIGRAHV